MESQEHTGEVKTYSGNKSQELIYATNGEPFKTEAAAKNSFTQQKLDPRIHSVLKLSLGDDGSEGWAIMRHPFPVHDDPTEKFWRVKFHGRQSVFEPEDVVLAVNGETLVCQREVETIIPDKFREAADHSVYQAFRQVPNKPRKNIGWIKTYPYELVGPGSRQEYTDQKTKGTQQTKEMIAKYGYEAASED